MSTRDDQFFTALTVPIPQLTTGTATLEGPGGFFRPAQTFGGAFGLPNAASITEIGAALGAGTTLSMTLAGRFCIPGAGGLIDSIARLPASGAIAVAGEIDLTGVLP